MVGVANAAQADQVTRRRHDDAGLALDGLNQDRRGLRRDRALHGTEIAKRHGNETRSEGTETVSIFVLG